MKQPNTYIILAIILIALVAGFYHQSTQIQVETFEIRSISSVDENGFALEGDLIINNNGLISVQLDRVTYTVQLQDSNDTLATGSIDGGILVRKSNTSLSLSQQIRWAPTIRTATQLILKDQVMATINGTARINIPLLGSQEIPFTQTFDIKSYLIDYLAQQAKETTIDELLNSNIATNIANILGTS